MIFKKSNTLLLSLSLSLLLVASLIIHTISENDDENPRPTEFPSALVN